MGTAQHQSGFIRTKENNEVIYICKFGKFVEK
jgi:hypothetical protein